MFDEKSHSLKMDKSIEAFSKELSSLRTGRANAAMLDIVRVDVYGQQMPINQVGSITTPEPRMINMIETHHPSAGTFSPVTRMVSKMDEYTSQNKKKGVSALMCHSEPIHSLTH